MILKLASCIIKTKNTGTETEARRNALVFTCTVSSPPRGTGSLVAGHSNPNSSEQEGQCTINENQPTNINMFFQISKNRKMSVSVRFRFIVYSLGGSMFFAVYKMGRSLLQLADMKVHCIHYSFLFLVVAFLELLAGWIVDWIMHMHNLMLVVLMKMQLLCI